MQVAEVILLLAFAVLLYGALAPLRRRVERHLAARQGSTGQGPIIPMSRRADGVFASEAERRGGDEHRAQPRRDHGEQS